MNDELLRLFWRDQFVGTISGAQWSDFPWAAGPLSIAELRPDIRRVLQYVSEKVATDEGLVDWPFAEEFGESWRIAKPDGTTQEISVPIIDFSDGRIEWR
jgi:hypothetical protein